jgi:hypothetical protein
MAPSSFYWNLIYFNGNKPAKEFYIYYAKMYLLILIYNPCHKVEQTIQVKVIFLKL